MLLIAGCSFNSGPLLAGGNADRFPTSGEGDHSGDTSDAAQASRDASASGAGSHAGIDAAASAPDAAITRDASASDAATPPGSGMRDAGSPVPDAQVEDARVEDAATQDAHSDAPDADASDSGKPLCPCVCPHALIDQPAQDPATATCAPVLCPIDDCAPDLGCRYAEHGGNGYYLCDAPHEWDDAQNDCVSLARGHLVAIESSDEDDFLFEQLDDKTWIGASDLEEEGTFRWETGVVFWRGGSPSVGGNPGGGGPGPGGMNGGAPAAGKYSNFLSYEPNDEGLGGGDADCVLTWPDQDTWADATCSDEHGYVCEFPLPATADPLPP